MSYSAEESSPVIAYITDSCCICNEEFSSDSELSNHLINHANDEEFKTGLLELEKKTPTKNQISKSTPSTPTTPKLNMPVKRTASQRSGSPEVWEIISDDSEEENDKSKKVSKQSNSFRLVSSPNKTSNNTVNSVDKLVNSVISVPDIEPSSTAGNKQRKSYSKTQNKPSLKNTAQSKSITSNVPQVNNKHNKALVASTQIQNKPSVSNHSQNKAIVATQKVTNKTPDTNKVQNGQIYKCNVCTSIFTDEKDLKDHLLAHDKEKQYVCHICKKQFLHRATLRQHLHQHIGDKSHQCKVCNKKFSLKSVLRKHEETHLEATQPTVQTRRTNVHSTKKQKSL